MVVVVSALQMQQPWVDILQLRFRYAAVRVWRRQLVLKTLVFFASVRVSQNPCRNEVLFHVGRRSKERLRENTRFHARRHRVDGRRPDLAWVAVTSDLAVEPHVLAIGRENVELLVVGRNVTQPTTLQVHDRFRSFARRRTAFYSALDRASRRPHEPAFFARVPRSLCWVHADWVLVREIGSAIHFFWGSFPFFYTFSEPKKNILGLGKKMFFFKSFFFISARHGNAVALGRSFARRGRV